MMGESACGATAGGSNLTGSIEAQPTKRNPATAGRSLLVKGDLLPSETSGAYTTTVALTPNGT